MSVRPTAPAAAGPVKGNGSAFDSFGFPVTRVDDFSVSFLLDSASPLPATPTDGAGGEKLPLLVAAGATPPNSAWTDALDAEMKSLVPLSSRAEEVDMYAAITAGCGGSVASSGAESVSSGDSSMPLADADELGRAIEATAERRLRADLFPPPEDMSSAFAGEDFLYPFVVAPSVNPDVLLSPGAAAALAPPAAGAAPVPHGAKRKAAEGAAALEPAAKRHVNSEVARRYNLSQQFAHLRRVARSEDTTQAGILQATLKTLRAYERRVMELTADVHGGGAAPPAAAAAAVKQERAPKPGAALKHKAFLDAGVAMSVALVSGQIVDVNESYTKLMKQDRAVLTNLSVFTVSHPDFTPRCYQMVNRLVSEEATVEQGRAKLINCQGDILTLHCAAWTVRVDGKPKFIVSMLTPIEAVPTDAAADNGPTQTAAV